MKSFFLLSLVCLLAISSAVIEENEIEVEFPDSLNFEEFGENNIFSTEVISELAEALEKSSASSTRSSVQTQSSTVAVVNDYVDKLLTNLNNFINSKGLNELELPSYSQSFEYKPALITYSGLLNITNGKLSGLSSIARKGDVKITYGGKQLSILVPVGINSLSIKYDYIAKIMKLGPTGGITGTVAETTFTFGLSYNLTGHRASLDTFTVNKIGSIKLHFSGNILTDWLASLVTNIILPLFKIIIKNVLEKNVYSVLESVIDLVNTVLTKLYP